MRKVREMDPGKFIVDTPVIDQELKRIEVRILLYISIGL